MQYCTSKEEQNCLIPLQTNNPNRINQHKQYHLSPLIITPDSTPVKISLTPQNHLYAFIPALSYCTFPFILTSYQDKGV